MVRGIKEGANMPLGRLVVVIVIYCLYIGGVNLLCTS